MTLLHNSLLFSVNDWISLLWEIDRSSWSAWVANQKPWLNIFFFLALTKEANLRYETNNFGRTWRTSCFPSHKSSWWNQLMRFRGDFEKPGEKNSNSHKEFQIKLHTIHFLFIFISRKIYCSEINLYEF